MTGFDELAERLDPGLVLDAVNQLGVVHVPGGQAAYLAAALVLELRADRATRSGSRGPMPTAERFS
jgi:hypothetical protein